MTEVSLRRTAPANIDRRRLKVLARIVLRTTRIPNLTDGGYVTKQLQQVLPFLPESEWRDYLVRRFELDVEKVRALHSGASRHTSPSNDVLRNSVKSGTKMALDSDLGTLATRRAEFRDRSPAFPLRSTEQIAIRLHDAPHGPNICQSPGRVVSLHHATSRMDQPRNASNKSSATSPASSDNIWNTSGPEVFLRTPDGSEELNRRSGLRMKSDVRAALRSKSREIEPLQVQPAIDSCASGKSAALGLPQDHDHLGSVLNSSDQILNGAITDAQLVSLPASSDLKLRPAVHASSASPAPKHTDLEHFASNRQTSHSDRAGYEQHELTECGRPGLGSRHSSLTTQTVSKELWRNGEPLRMDEHGTMPPWHDLSIATADRSIEAVQGNTQKEHEVAVSVQAVQEGDAPSATHVDIEKTIRQNRTDQPAESSGHFISNLPVHSNQGLLVHEDSEFKTSMQLLAGLHAMNQPDPSISASSQQQSHRSAGQPALKRQCRANDQTFKLRITDDQASTILSNLRTCISAQVVLLSGGRCVDACGTNKPAELNQHLGAISHSQQRWVLTDNVFDWDKLDPPVAGARLIKPASRRRHRLVEKAARRSLFKQVGELTGECFSMLKTGQSQPLAGEGIHLDIASRSSYSLANKPIISEPTSIVEPEGSLQARLVRSQSGLDENEPLKTVATSSSVLDSALLDVAHTLVTPTDSQGLAKPHRDVAMLSEVLERGAEDSRYRRAYDIEPLRIYPPNKPSSRLVSIKCINAPTTLGATRQQSQAMRRRDRAAQNELQEMRAQSSGSLVETSEFRAYLCRWAHCGTILHGQDALDRHCQRMHAVSDSRAGLQCHWLGCERISTSFESRAQWHNHIAMHTLAQEPLQMEHDLMRNFWQDIIEKPGSMLNWHVEAAGARDASPTQLLTRMEHSRLANSSAVSCKLFVHRVTAKGATLPAQFSGFEDDWEILQDAVVHCHQQRKLLLRDRHGRVG
ncbi:hypothetical protein PYCC9005_006048 [Savitreella phatthalungensis]